jgi:hypothetical protein
MVGILRAGLIRLEVRFFLLAKLEGLRKVGPDVLWESTWAGGGFSGRKSSETPKIEDPGRGNSPEVTREEVIRELNAADEEISSREASVIDQGQ